MNTSNYSNWDENNSNDEPKLESRLIEFLKKRKYCKENKIDTSNLNKEFMITDFDIGTIKAFMKGDKIKYSNTHSDYIDLSQSSFPSSNFKKDKRFENIKNKQKKETDAQNQRHDYMMISKSYDMYRDDRQFASATGNDFTKSSFNPNQWMNGTNGTNGTNETDKISNVNGINNLDEQNKWMNLDNDHIENNKWSQFNENVKQNKINNQNYKNKKGYLDKNKQRYCDNKQQSDLNNNQNINSQGIYNTYLSSDTTVQSDKNTVDEFISNLENINKTQDVDIDTYVKFGNTPFRAGKSLGYPTVMEHSFSYISPDIQNHTVMNRGIPSRMFNKEIARPNN
jgi:hypothetical protein